MSRIRIYTAPGESPDLLESLRMKVRVREIASLGEIAAAGGDGEEAPAVLLLSRGLLAGMEPGEWETLPAHVSVVAADAEARASAEGADRLFLSMEDLRGDPEGLGRVVRSAARQSAALLEGGRARVAADRAHLRLRRLNEVGMALMSERDPEVLLGSILAHARALTGSDAGSLYLVEAAQGGDAGGGGGGGGADRGQDDERSAAHLHFLRAQNDSLPGLPDPDFTLPLDRTSLAGYVASTGEILVIEDAYDLPADAPYTFNPGYDREHGYRARSMLVAPMIDHRDRVVGVLQLINRKDDPRAVIRGEADADAHVLPYGEAEVETVRSLAGQAAVSIENGMLYRDIENLFEGFIRAAVTAIDRRDPTTSGHSVRVTELTCDMARLVHEQSDGPFADVSFTPEEMKQLRYAGLLHDFGKVGVREEVLVKMKKLPPVMEAEVNARFSLIRAVLRADFLEAKAALLEGGPVEADAALPEGGPAEVDTALPEGGPADAESSGDAARSGEGVAARSGGGVARLEEELEDALARVERYHAAVREANVPRVLPEEAAGILQEIAGQCFVDADGQEIPYLTAAELHYLSIPKGSLDDSERRQIESHVIHGIDFLEQIPWTPELRRIAEIVRGHHEKLNGTGYPDGVTAEHLSLETRIMTVCDIFDALTASDRPYKKAMPVERALEILRMEAAEGALEPDIVELFASSGVYRKVLEGDWREF